MFSSILHSSLSRSFRHLQVSWKHTTLLSFATQSSDVYNCIIIGMEYLCRHRIVLFHDCCLVLWLQVEDQVGIQLVFTRDGFSFLFL